MADEYREDFDDYEDYEEKSQDPQWRMLTPKERKQLMKRVFSNQNWYDDDKGTPVFQGGTANPMFETIAERVGAPLREIKRYYSAWLNAQGYSPSEAFKLESETETTQQNPSDSYSPYAKTDYDRVTPQPSQFDSNDPMDSMMMNAMNAEVNKNSGSNDSMGMMFMMKFLTDQQQMAMQQQQFQMMQMMEQRKLDQMRESDLRRESMARDQQFMNQQMTFMRDMSKKSGDDGFFDSEFKGIFKEKVLDTILVEKDDGWKDSVKEVLGSDTLKAAVGGLGAAVSSRVTPSQIPAGYDQPDYDPYKQTTLKPEAANVNLEPSEILQSPANPADQSGVFFSEEEQPTPQVPQYTEDDYRKILFTAFSEAMGAAAQDEQVLSALQSQVEVAVQTTLVEIPDAIPQIKLQKMNEKLLLIRNLRDLGIGLMDLRERTEVGQEPSPLLIGAIVEELRKNPEFYKIFAEHSYDELMATVEPFKSTGAVEKDYAYLLEPEVQEVCRPLLEAVSLDFKTRGFPATG